MRNAQPNKSLQAIPINAIGTFSGPDGVQPTGPESLRDSASRAYSPVGPRTFTRFTSLGPACLSSGR
jgi:hypothetical protein